MERRPRAKVAKVTRKELGWVMTAVRGRMRGRERRKRRRKRRERERRKEEE